METFAPRDAHEVTDIIAAALANDIHLEVAGHGTKRDLGRPLSAEKCLSTAGLSNVSLYEPSELVLSAAAGTPIREIQQLIGQQGQELAFEPMDYGVLYGKEPMSGTIGGVFAVNASGPRRIKAGAARDHLLGFHAVSGRAGIFQSGGRVMKNVTGYDLSKLMSGSYGTLAVLTEVTLKVLPKAETEETLLIAGFDDAEAIEVLMEASGLPHEVSSFAHVPAAVAGRIEALEPGQSLTALRLEGPEVSVAKRKRDLIDHFKGRRGEFHSLGEAISRIFWTVIRDCAPLASLDAHIWRISTAPSEGAATVAAIRQSGVDVKGWYYDWAGGLIWLATAHAPNANSPAIRAAVDAAGGHATLIRAPGEIRLAAPVFHPQPAALAALSVRVKRSFDPDRILNRGRLREDL
jgi:glycolate oxidase FAD binding subunit